MQLGQPEPRSANQKLLVAVAYEAGFQPWMFMKKVPKFPGRLSVNAGGFQTQTIQAAKLRSVKGYT